MTENGLGEGADANRAPYLVAHLEQMFAAIRDGVDVFGFFYWSLVDNWEWLEHYRPAGRHGLFAVDRRTPELPRAMTEAAIILRHLVAERGLGHARARFGTFSADGSTVQRPRLSAGRLYAGQLTAGARRQDFELYLSVRADGTLLGLLYYMPGEQGAMGDLWMALSMIQLEEGRLRFGHEPVPGRVAAAAYTVAPGDDPRVLTGQATVGDGAWQVAAALQPLGFYPCPPGP